MSRTLTSTNTTDLGNVVYNAFLRVTKQYNLYATFQKVFRQRCAPHRPSSDDKIGGFHNIAELIEQVKRQAQREFESHAREGNDYERITFIINVLLRTFLEGGGVAPQKLGMYGQEIFDLACYRLYGEKYLDDMDSINNGAPRPRNEFESMLIGHYMAHVHQGGTYSWEEWCQRNAIAIEKMRRQFDPSGPMMMHEPPTFDMDEDEENDDWPF